MSVGYSLAYRSGITPWEHRNSVPDPPFERLLDREEVGRERPFGRALDLGCGTGHHTRLLQTRGWEVMGVDSSRHAVDTAIDRGGESSRYVIGDVAHLPGCGVGKGFDLFLDVGCFHGRRPADRTAMGRGVTELASPGAVLLMMCFPRGRRLFGANGADADDISAAFPEWELLDVRDADTSCMTGPVARHKPRWYRLALTAGPSV
ncbi:class I SAM-dependent methyltransferase [Nocardioides taihuensis]|uniref:Class I SAM-dependent methyltransferase n=1 Tax=Nocardioides taihuensis TaxID=1835606 RepID=A0ABW0BQG3_9ACTN